MYIITKSKLLLQHPLKILASPSTVIALIELLLVAEELMLNSRFYYFRFVYDLCNSFENLDLKPGLLSLLMLKNHTLYTTATD